MPASLRLPLLLAVALVWIQTAAAWHESDHALHGHSSDDLACEILAGTADQPLHETSTAQLGTPVPVDSVLSNTADSRDVAVTLTYRSRAPPSSR